MEGSVVGSSSRQERGSRYSHRHNNSEQGFKEAMDRTDSRAHEEKDNVVVVEEDWSHHLAGSKRDDDGTACGGTPPDRNRFAYYDTVVFPLSEPSGSGKPLSMELRCVDGLTPLDMLDLSSGVHDATGNRVWMGAVLFLESMVRPLPLCGGDATPTQRKRAAALAGLRAELFRGRDVLELGCGTGASLIALGLAAAAAEAEAKEGCSDDAFPVPRSLTLTDNDPVVLELCRANCEANLGGRKGGNLPSIAVEPLDWGEFCAGGGNDHTAGVEAGRFAEAPPPKQSGPSCLSESRDTVVATDVVYDVGAVPLLFAAAGRLLRRGGRFVLAHVPRASVDEDATDPSRITEALEELIARTAADHGFVGEANDQDGGEGDAALALVEAACREEEEEAGDRDDRRERKGSPRRPRNILRPGLLAELWKPAAVGSGDTSAETEAKTKATPLVSGDYTYDELESCGASILVFAKKRTEAVAG